MEGVPVQVEYYGSAREFELAGNIWLLFMCVIVNYNRETIIMINVTLLFRLVLYVTVEFVGWLLNQMDFHSVTGVEEMSHPNVSNARTNALTIVNSE